MKEVLICEPKYFDVKNDYNSRMKDVLANQVLVNKNLALAQWLEMATTIKFDLKILVHRLEPVPDLCDMVFACDPGLWIDDLFIVSNFEPVPRRAETNFFVGWFHDHGYEIKFLNSLHSCFEGGDCLFVKDKLLLGYKISGFPSSRTNGSGVREVTAILKHHGIKVLPVERITQNFYHLNSVMTYYPSVELLAVYPKAFNRDDLFNIKKELNVEIVELGDEALFRNLEFLNNQCDYSYALNSIEKDGKVLLPYCSDELLELLVNRNLTPIVPELGSSEFEKSGGSYRCMMNIHNITK